MNPSVSVTLACRPLSFACRLLSFVLLCIYAPLSGLAQTASIGMVAGRISNASTGAYLEGVEVTVAGLPPVLTDRSGGFTFSNVPAGTQVIRAYYTGLDVATQSVEVRAGQTAQAMITLGSSVVQLEAYTVSSSREGEAASITKQRNADNIVNVVSTEAFGAVADGNIGNFMVRLSGVAGEFENGEIVGIKIRGTPVEFSALNVDGVRAAGAFSGFNTQGDRGAQSDQIPAEFIKEVEVTKAATPDQPADSIGGSTNLVTKSALDFKEDVLTYRVGVNYNTFRSDLQNFTPNAAMSYLTRIGRDRNIGMALSLSYTDTEAPRDRVQTARTFNDGRATQARSLSNINERIRMGGGLKFDYRFSPDTSIYLKLQFNYYKFDSPQQVYAASAAGSSRIADYSVVSRAQIEAGTPARTSTNQTAGAAPGFTDGYTELVSATWLNEATWNVKLGRQYVGEIGGEKNFSGDQKITAKVTYNPSNFASNLRSFDMNLVGNIGMSIDSQANRSRPIFRQTYGPDIGMGTDFKRYTARLLQQPERSEEEVANVKLDYTKMFHGRFPLRLQAGTSWRQQHRTLSVARPNWTFGGPDRIAGTLAATGANDDNLAQFISSGPGHPLFDQRNGVWPDLPAINFPAVWRAFSEHPEWFIPEGTSVSAAPNFSEITEDVSAAYVLGRLQVHKLNIVTGVRFEQTDVSASGRYTDPRNPDTNRTHRDRSYHDYFPSLHFKYPILARLTARASISTGAARPNMTDLYPTTTVSYNTTTGLGSVSTSNPGLLPQTSENLDFSLEYYFEPAGQFSVGYFRKDIKNFLYRTSDEIDYGPDNGFDGQFGGFTLNSTYNGGAADVEGWEFNYSQQLTFLPKPFNGLGIFANYTTLRTTGTYAEGARALAGFVPKTANAGASFRWRKLEARASWRYTSAYLRSYNANIYQQNSFRPVENIDLSMQYKFSRKFAFYIDAINVTNNWPQNFTGTDESRVTFADDYGVRYNIGFTGRF